MSWHTSGFLVRANWHSRRAEIFQRLGFTEPELAETVSFAEATSFASPGHAIGYIDGWTAVWDTYMFLDLQNPQPPAPQSLWPPRVDAGLAQLSASTEVFSLLLEGASATFGFALYRHGNRVRCYLKQANTVCIDFGDIIPEEVDASAKGLDEEARVLLLLERLTVPVRRLAEIPYDVYRFREDCQIE